MVNQPKRIEVIEGTDAVNGQTTVDFGPGTGTILRRLVNYHNIWWGFTVEPELADANAQGTWILWVKPDETQADTDWTDANIVSNNFNQFIIACGVWGASNEMPYTFSSQLRTSRNLVANQRLALTVHTTGLTTGNVSVRCILCASLSVK